MENKKIYVSNLEYDQIKANLKEFLRAQDEFSDFDFEGSGMAVLIDLLAYNTHYNALYQNLTVNESFLDSASKRDSVVSIAKSLSYTPKSSTAPKATVTLTVSNTATSPATLTLPKHSRFSATVDGTSYSFYTLTEQVTTINDAGNYVFEDVEIYEGRPLVFTYEFDPNTEIIIPNSNTDLDTLKVTVAENPSTTEIEVFSLADSLVDITSDSLIYFVTEIPNNKYRIEFGNGTLGKPLSTGNIITLEYLVTHKTEANGVRLFSYQGSPLLGGVVSVNTTAAAAGGAEEETIDDIKFLAPRMYSAQNRAVTAEDYRAIIDANKANIESIHVWGGEEHNPPTYGKVFISVKPKNALTLTELEKEEVINNILANRKVLAIIPEIVDPEFLTINFKTTVYFDPQKTTLTEKQIKTLVTNVISDYNTRDLQKFDSVFRFSKLSKQIDRSHQSILSNSSSVTLTKTIEPIFNTNMRYEINIGNPIFTGGIRMPGFHADILGVIQRGGYSDPPASVLSTGFKLSGDPKTYFIDDDGRGKLRLFHYVSVPEDMSTFGIKSFKNEDFGTIDYSAGTLVIPKANVESVEGLEWKFNIKPASNDVATIRNQLLLMPNQNVVVEVISDRFAQTGQPFIHTPR